MTDIAIYKQQWLTWLNEKMYTPWNKVLIIKDFELLKKDREAA